MTISVKCTCGKRLQAKDEFAGKKVRCPICRNISVLPKPGDAAVYTLASPAARTPSPALASDQPDGSDRNDETAEKSDEGLPTAPRSRPRKKKRKKRRATASQSFFRDHLYLIFALALIPLAISLFATEGEDFGSRLSRTIAKAPQDVRNRVARIVDQIDNGDADESELFAALPEGKIEGAHLPRKTWMHWIYAFASATAFFSLLLLIFPRAETTPYHILGVGFFTATAGIIFLLIVQFLAIHTEGIWVRGRGILTLLFYILKFIGFSYRSALDPESNFILSMLGFTFGVGLCEELCKVLPLIAHFRRKAILGWREACLWGLACGIGFGVAEGIMYSSDYYNGIQSGSIYIVRFVSCVALHAVWSASVGITLYNCQAAIQDGPEWYEWGLGLLRILGVAMVLHGLYDTLLKKEMHGLALVVALASFAWLAIQIEIMRHIQGSDSSEPALA